MKKVFYKSTGTGGLITKDPETGVRYVIQPNRHTPVSDLVAANLKKEYPNKITILEDEGAVAEVKKEALSHAAENKALKVQVEKLQLIAAQIPVDLSGELAAARAEIEELKAKVATLEAKPKRGRPAKADTTDASGSPEVADTTAAE